MAQGVVDKREVILRAAGKVIAERGYHATGIADIARELGAGHGTFYRYFKNKEDIARSLVLRALGQMQEAIADEEPQAARTLAEYREQVRRIGDKLFDLVAAEPDLARVLFYDAAAIARTDPGLLGAAVENAGAYTAAFIRNGQTRGFVRRELDPQVVGLAVNGMILAGCVQLLHVRNAEEMRTSWIRTVEALMFDGLGGN
ncbi:TetR/AcrR family transcriptional regulator [Streptomyces sp. WMMB 322]|uniref:TetR/AcrR family transcriptional regulator n=1 Tax=Streptomyces sp. WMMB 322 TaxID=1286821 RepID=UPI00082399C3|nr:TetR/AcrR family transcriptional regulator [Streptomyces sp. WMMB 322]SCK45869.1 transcriptional regulator, TetR family [Streptomyces sp. WMMB 322]